VLSNQSFAPFESLRLCVDTGRGGAQRSHRGESCQIVPGNLGGWTPARPAFLAPLERFSQQSCLQVFAIKNRPNLSHSVALGGTENESVNGDWGKAHGDF
jgi:hypothetical protein